MPRWVQVLVYNTFPLSVGLWIVTWIPNKGVLPSWIAAVVGGLVLAAELFALEWLANIQLPHPLQAQRASWRLLLLSLTSGSALFAGILARYLGGPIGFSQVLLALGMIAGIRLGRRSLS